MGPYWTDPKHCILISTLDAAAFFVAKAACSWSCSFLILLLPNDAAFDWLMPILFIAWYYLLTSNAVADWSANNFRLSEKKSIEYKSHWVYFLIMLYSSDAACQVALDYWCLCQFLVLLLPANCLPDTTCWLLDAGADFWLKRLQMVQKTVHRVLIPSNIF